MKEVADSLAGRVAIFELETLSIAELDRAISNWSALLVRGLFPELWRAPALLGNDFYASYVATYLERDVRQILNVHNLRDFERFIRATAVRSGQQLNIADIARDVGIKPHTARDWLSVLEASNQITLLEPYFESLGKRIVKSPKLYWNDVGLLCFLLGLDQDALDRSPLVGAVWETFVFSELRKQIKATGANASLWYYRDSQAREVDFLRVANGKIDLIEVKWTEAPDARWFRSLGDIAKTIAKSQSYAVGDQKIICRVAQPRTVDGVQVINPTEIWQ